MLVLTGLQYGGFKCNLSSTNRRWPDWVAFCFPQLETGDAAAGVLAYCKATPVGLQCPFQNADGKRGKPGSEVFNTNQNRRGDKMISRTLAQIFKRAKYDNSGQIFRRVKPLGCGDLCKNPDSSFGPLKGNWAGLGKIILVYIMNIELYWKSMACQTEQ